MKKLTERDKLSNSFEIIEAELEAMEEILASLPNDNSLTTMREAVAAMTYQMSMYPQGE